MMRLLRAAGHPVMRWKNGGGFTTEVAVFPARAALDAFDWRISMADVASDGAFSRFPGIDRTLAILSGEGMRLDIENEPTLDLTRETAPAIFPADAATHATLIAGPIRDLNVMTRRGVFAHKVTRHVGPEKLNLSRSAATVIALSRMKALWVECRKDGAHAVLDVDDAAIIDDDVTLTPNGGGEFYVIELWAEGPAARQLRLYK